MEKYISECPLSKIVNQLHKGELKPEIFIDKLYRKIDKRDRKVEAFIEEKERRERLQREVGELYTRFPDSARRPPLFAIPVGIKDIFRVDGFSTKAGSELPSAVFKGEEAAVVTKLKNAGALILGKTVTTEFAYFQAGPTKNPNNLLHTPGGSSSGSAAAVAAGFCPLALGTQTIGSISRPAAYCGVYGFKPSYGRIPTEGVLPFSPSADHVGFFTQDLEGSRMAASLLCQDWKNDPPTSSRLPNLAVPSGTYLQQASKDIQASFHNDITAFKKAGCKVKELNCFENIDHINSAHSAMIAYEFARVHQSWFQDHKAKYSQESKQLIQKGKEVSYAKLIKAKQGRLLLRDKLMKLMKSENIDLCLSPAATSTAPPGLSSTGDPAMSLPWTYAGLPTLSLPWGDIDGLPYGLQATGKFYQDEQLLSLAKICKEQT